MYALNTISIATVLIFGVQCDNLLNLPNILFIIADDLRPEIGIYGAKNAYTPNIDTLAKNSIIFTKAYTQVIISHCSVAYPICLCTCCQVLLYVQITTSQIQSTNDIALHCNNYILLHHLLLFFVFCLFSFIVQWGHL